MDFTRVADVENLALALREDAHLDDSLLLVSPALEHLLYEMPAVRWLQLRFRLARFSKVQLGSFRLQPARMPRHLRP